MHSLWLGSAGTGNTGPITGRMLESAAQFYISYHGRNQKHNMLWTQYWARPHHPCSATVVIQESAGSHMTKMMSADPTIA